MNISAVARQTGLSAKTIRFYEAQGVISEPGRSDNGYRVYSERHLSQLAFIKRARDLGFSLLECSELLALSNDPGRRSADVKRKFAEKLHWIDQEIKRMEAARQFIEELEGCCPGDDQPDCPIIDRLQQG